LPNLVAIASAVRDLKLQKQSQQRASEKSNLVTYLISRVRNSVRQVNAQRVRQPRALPADRARGNEELALIPRDAVRELELRARGGDAACDGEALHGRAAVGAEGEAVGAAVAVADLGQRPHLARRGVAAGGDEYRCAVRG
jgi:hypothetical protein